MRERPMSTPATCGGPRSPEATGGTPIPAPTAIEAIENKLGGFRTEREGEAETLVLGMNMPGVDDSDIRRSMELFAAHVMPRFQ